MKFCTAIILNASYLKASFFKNTAYKTAVITARKSHATPTGEAVNEKSLSIEVWEYFVQHGEVVEKQKKRYPKKIQRTSRRFLFYSQRFGRYFVIFK